MKFSVGAKRHIKRIMHGIILPAAYALSRRRAIDPMRVIAASGQKDSLPAELVPIVSLLKKNGFTVEEFCLDLGKCGAFSALRFLLRFMRHYANASAVFISDYFLAASSCRKREETSLVQLWHAGGVLKKFGYDAEDDLAYDKKKTFTKNYTLVTVSAPVCIPHYESAFALAPGICRATGVSRTDRLMNEGFRDAARAEFFAEYPELRGKKILLWAPTFRGNAGAPETAGIREMLAMKASLPDDTALVIKLHPHTEALHPGLSCPVDTEKLMCAADMLITDYSTVIFDYSLLQKPIVLYMPDYSEYMAKRGTYIDFPAEVPARLAYNRSELEEAVKKPFDAAEKHALAAFRQKYMSACDGSATERIYEEVFRVIN